MAQTQPEPDAKTLDPWCNLGVQISILPSEKGLDPVRLRDGTYQMTTDNGRRWTYQGMIDRPMLVVWNEWWSSFRATIGYVRREEVFTESVEALITAKVDELIKQANHTEQTR